MAKPPEIVPDNTEFIRLILAYPAEALARAAAAAGEPSKEGPQK